MVEITNLNAGRLRRQAAVVLPSLLVVLSMAGVAARPNLSLSAAKLDLLEAEKRVSERQLHADNLARFRESGGLARTEAMLAVVRDMVPAPLPKLELHGLVRMLAARCGVELSGLEIREPYDSGLEPSDDVALEDVYVLGVRLLDDVAALREVHVEGESRLAELRLVLAAFQALGRPVVVLELHVARAQEQGRYHWTVVFGLFESLPPSALEPSEQTSSQEGSP